MEGLEVIGVTHGEFEDCLLLYSNNTDFTGETAIGIPGYGVPKSYGKARLKPGQSYSADCQFVGINRCRL